MIQFTEEQDKAAREWNEAFDYRALRNGVQCGNILMLHLDEVNKRAMELYAAQQVAAERERIRKIAGYYVHKDNWTKFEKEIDSL